MALEQEFGEVSYRHYEEARRLGYDAVGYLRKAAELGPLKAAKHFLANAKPQDGFTRLWMMRRLDLSIEALVESEKFRPLFTEVEIQTATERLDAVQYVRWK
jgi:hypothetical protein